MQDSALYPPNCTLLSDSVIGPVTASRRINLRSTIQDANCSFVLNQCPKGTQLTAVPFCGPRSAAPQQSTPPAAHPLGGFCLNGASSEKPKPLRRSATRLTAMSSRGKVDEAKAAFRRRRRETMARYRQKISNKETAFVESIQQLKEEIQRLQLQRQLAQAHTLTEQTPWTVVTQYYHLFQNGYVSPETGNVHQNELNVQRDFLRATMDHDVLCDAICGIEALLDNWKFIALCFDDLDVQIVRLGHGPDGSMICTVTATFTITEQTIIHGFPHLVGDNNSCKWSPIALKLLGKKLLVRAHTQFFWDETTSRITRMASQADLFTPFYDILGDLEEVALVFSNAQLSGQGRSVRAVAND